MAGSDQLDEVLATDPEGLHEQALRRVKKRRDLHTHAFVYLILNVVLWGIWAVVGATSYPWPLWVSLGWASAWCSTPGTSTSASRSPRTRSAARWIGCATRTDAMRRRAALAPAR